MANHPSSYWCMKPFCCRTAHASSIVTVFMRSRMSSGTFGLPSAKRSPCHSGVYLITSSAVKNPCCAFALEMITVQITRQRTPTRTTLPFILLRSPFVLCRVWLKPACSRHLRLTRDLFLHLHSKPRLVTRCDVALLD